MTDVLGSVTLDGWLDAVLRLTGSSGLVLLAVGALDVLLSRRVSARWRAMLYLAVFARLALPLGWSSPAGLIERRLTTAPVAVAPASPAPRPAVAGASAVPAGAVPRAVGRPLQLGVAALLAMGWLALHARTARMLRRAWPASDRVRALAGDLPVVEHPRCGPAVHGLLRPRIVLPAPLLATLDDEALRAILRHEHAHLRRRDPWRLALLQAATLVAWPLLPAWLAAWRVRGLMEQACDEQALADVPPAGRRHYGETLIAVAQWQPLRARFALGLSFGGGLAPRLRALRPTKRWPSPAQAALAGSLAIACVLASGVRTVAAVGQDGAGQAPPLVVMELRVFPGASLPAVAEELAILGEADRRIVGRGDASELLAALSASKDAPPRSVLRGWLGGRNSLRVRAPGVSETLAPLVLAWTMNADRDRLALTLSWPRTQETWSVDVPLREGESAIVLARSLGAGPETALLFTPLNVSWEDGPRVQSPRADVELSERDVSEALMSVGSIARLPITTTAPAEGLVSVSLDDAPVERIVDEVAHAAGLVPRLGENGVLELVASPEGMPSRIERAARRAGATVERMVPDGDRLDVTLLLPGPVVPETAKAAVDALEAEGFSVVELRLTSGHVGAVIEPREAAAPLVAEDPGDPVAVVRAALERCQADVARDGSRLRIEGTCETPIALAHLLRRLEDDWSFADVALHRQVDDDAGTGTRFEVSASWRPARRVRLATEAWRVDGAALDALFPGSAGQPPYAAMTGDAAGMAAYPGRAASARAALAELVASGRASRVAGGEGVAGWHRALPLDVGPLRQSRQLTLSAEPVMLDGSLGILLRGAWEGSAAASASTRVPATFVVTLGRGDLLLVLVEADPVLP